MILPESKDIKHIRKKLKITQKELAKRTQLPQSSISRIETNSMDPPYSKMKKVILTLYKEDPEMFFARSELIRLLSEKLSLCGSPIEKMFYVYTFDKIPELTPQYPIDKMHVDFAIPSLKIAIECDGFENHSTTEQRNRDNWRDAFLNSIGWIIQRFTGNDILTNIDRCINRILKIVNYRKRHFSPNNS